jgi:hypothetical protein
VFTLFGSPVLEDLNTSQASVNVEGNTVTLVSASEQVRSLKVQDNSGTIIGYLNKVGDSVKVPSAGEYVVINNGKVIQKNNSSRK